tara:strand:- start:72 stop:1046 length:975 start_codon:yes stop_codon:yes gene_type:complete
MAYVAGDTILDDEYQTFVASSSDPYGWNHFAGTGAGQYGLGQAHLVEVTPNATTITAAQWNALLTAMDNVANHTNDSLTARTAVVTGDTISIKAAVAADLATLAASVAGGCVSATALSAGSELQSSRSATRYAGSHIVEHTVTFANGNNLRYFFNSGGKIRVNLTRVSNGGGSATDKDDSVDEMITAMGNFDIGAQVSTRSGTSETLTTDGFANGVDDLGTGYTTIFLLTQANGTYTSMTLKGEAKVDNATYGTAVSVTIKMSLTDADSGDAEFTDGNTSSIDQFENFIGTTDFATKLMLPTTAQGLDPVYTLSGSAETSNSTA